MISVTDLPRWVRIAGACAASISTFLWGGMDLWMVGLLVFVVLDYITGVIAAYISKTLSSRVGFVGILKKLLFLCVVTVAHIIDKSAGLGGVLRNAAVGFLVANEGLSILENCGRCGLPIPKKLLDALEQLKKKDEDE